MDRETLEEIKNKEIEEARRRSRMAYDMEAAESIVFDDINEEYNMNSFVNLDSIIDNIDLDDYEY